MKTRLWAAAVGLAALSYPGPATAEEPSSPERCFGAIHRGNVVACALAGSPALREQLAAQRAAEGRREAARPFLPSNPTLSGSVASRVGPTDRATNWSVSLGQELELAGQRGLRVDVADGEVRAQGHRVTAARREVATQAWAAYFRVLAVQERVALAAKLEQATGSVAVTVRAMATNGLASEVDADIAETAALRATTDRLSLEAAVAAAKAQLNRATGGRPEVVVEGALDPLSLPAARVPREQLPAVLALEEERQAAGRRVDLLRRQRVPNPTLSLLAQNDGFDERVLGVGLSLPVPLPQPVGRTNAGQIAEARGLAERASAEAEQLDRDLQAELVTATAELDAARQARALYTPERVERAVGRLASIAAQVKAARLAVRDALFAQQALVEQLKAEIDAREALCLASVRLARAAGAALEGDAP